MPSAVVGIVHSDPGAWQASHTYVGPLFRRPVTPNGLIYETVSGGVSGSTEPGWPSIVGGTVTDGTVTWTCTGDLNDIAIGGGPIITVPLNGDTGVPQAIVTAVGMLTDWTAATAQFAQNFTSSLTSNANYSAQTGSSPAVGVVTPAYTAVKLPGMGTRQIFTVNLPDTGSVASQGKVAFTGIQLPLTLNSYANSTVRISISSQTSESDVTFVVINGNVTSNSALEFTITNVGSGNASSAYAINFLIEVIGGD